jgi:biotin operon repressor
MPDRPEFKQSRETQIVYDLLLKASQGDGFVSWRELCAATEKGRREIQSAIRTAVIRMRRDHGVVFENDRDMGYRMRVDNQLVNSGQSAIERARRTEKIALEKMGCCEIGKLNPEERAAHLVTKSALELSLLVKRSRVRNNLTQMVIRKHNELDQQELLEAVVDRLGKK